MAVRKGLESTGFPVTLRNVRQATPQDLQTHDLLVLGCSTWENGALQKDFKEFLPRIGDLRLDGHHAAVFGPGSQAYAHFCQAVDLLEREIDHRGARIVSPSLRIDGTGYSARPLARDWGREVGTKMASLLAAA